jgi:hypothetical protein
MTALLNPIFPTEVQENSVLKAYFVSLVEFPVAGL